MASSNAFTAMCSPFLTGRNFASKLKKTATVKHQGRPEMRVRPSLSHPILKFKSYVVLLELE